MSNAEDLIRAAFAAKAASVTEPSPESRWQATSLALGSKADGRRPHHTRRWLIPLAAAAAVVVAAAVTVGAVSLAQGHHPASPATRIAPVPSPPAATPTPTPLSSAPTSTAGAATQQLGLTFSGGTRMSVTVPQGWAVSKTQPDGCCSSPQTVCVVAPGGEYAGDSSNCALAVTLTQLSLGLSPDVPWPVGNQQSCAAWKTTAENETTISGRPVEYRRFLNTCNGLAAEQWTTMSTPQVVFWHPLTAVSTAAVVATAVDSAVLPAVTNAHRAYDVGYIRGVTKQADGYHLQIDRVVPNLDGTVINVSPGTFDYLIYGIGFAGAPEPPVCVGPDTSGCTNEYLLAQFKKGPHPADGSYAIDGAYVELTMPGDNNAMEPLFSSPRAFKCC
jgi:hypothetical protein